MNHGSTAVFSSLTFSVKRKSVYIADEEEEFSSADVDDSFSKKS